MTVDHRGWRKSSYSGTQTNCVEVAPRPGATAVRDSKNRDAGSLVVRRTAWTAFIRDAAAQSTLRRSSAR